MTVLGVVFTHVDVGSGDHLVFDFDTGSVTLESTGESMRRCLLAASSSWTFSGVPGLQPGLNQIGLSGADGTILWHHAHWG